ncbi:intermembrane phospholipid transport protein YdbH family protein [Desulfobacter curvatus]|uniref:intermembrane phospholipid transport protein YdbH family protein n=1 Tax=Desulfobacter curvatus TaxID=2290 RepID=UPI00037BD60E|nr:YdbH domain-containing protein [Desulfobacter curvatus]
MPFKVVLKILLPVCLLLVLSIQCVIVFLPEISRHLVRSTLGPLPGNVPVDFTVSRLGVNDTQINDVFWGEDLRLDTIRLRCRLDTKNIISIENVILSGLNVTLHLDEKKRIRISGFSFPQERDQEHSDHVFNISAFEPYFAYLPAHIILKNSTIFIETGKDRFSIPVAGDVHLDRQNHLGDMKLSIFPMNQKIILGATGNFLQGPVEMKISSDRLYPEMLVAMVPDQGQVLSNFCGPVKFAIETKDFSTFHFELNDLGLELDPGLNINFPKISGGLSSDKAAMVLTAEGPIRIRGPGIGLGSFRFDISSRITSEAIEQFSLTVQNDIAKTWEVTPELLAFPLSTVNFFDKIQLVDPQFRLRASGNLEHQEGTLALLGTCIKALKNDDDELTGVLDVSGVQVTTEFNGNFARPESLKHIEFKSLINKIAFQQSNIEMRTASVDASSNAEFIFSNSNIVLDSAKARIKSRAIHLKQEDIKADIPEFNFESVVKKGTVGKDLVLNINAVCNKARIVSKAGTAFMGKAGITGKIEKPFSADAGYQITPFLYDTDITKTDQSIGAKGVHFELPVTYPFRNIKTFGRAGAKKIILHDSVIPAVSAKVVQTSGFAVDMTGTLTHAGFPGLVIDFFARAGLDSVMSPFAKGQIATNQFSVTHNTLIPFIPGISGVYDLKFDISAGADFSYANQKINSSADIQVSNGTINFIESGFSASGISADMHFNDLMVPETLPGQYINIDTFNAGRFNSNNAKIRFSLEDGKSINIENLKFNWCNGIVSTEAFRVPSDDKTIHLTLYCDRLEMEDLFYQLGAFDAEGGGTVSGRIPVVMKNTEIGTEIRFDNGFLFSTPGEGGRIYIKNLDRMLAGIPKNTREFSQLDLAGEALKNFEYKWVKLKLNTHGDTLAVNMQLDGKPVSALPFEYKRNLNSFIRVDAQSPGSNFQGIKLDVNLTLPFNQVIQLSNNLKRIMNP